MPETVEVAPGAQVKFEIVVQGLTNASVDWSVVEADGGTVTSAGEYTAPATAGTFHVVATSRVDGKSAGRATVHVGVPTAPSDPTAPNSESGDAPTPPPPPPGVVPAFVGAEGAGTATPGGRGGAVIEVTNLNDSGAGSLRACVEASGPRTCVFRVAGTIALRSTLDINNPFLTIAGQTAPGGGIQITANSYQDDLFRVNAHDVVLRYLRLRQGYNGAPPFTSGGNGGGAVFAITNGSQYNIVVDHVSMTWAMFKTVSIWSMQQPGHRDITLSWNLLAEPLWPSNSSVNMNTGSVSPTISDTMTDIDLHHNVFSKQNHRAPLLCTRSGRLVNNYVYEWRYYATRLKGSWDVIGNYYKAGPFSGSSPVSREIHLYTSGEANATTAQPSVYLTSNLGPHNNWDPSEDEWATLTGMSIDQSQGEATFPALSGLRRGSPLSTPAGTAPISSFPASEVPAKVLPTVGASRRLDCDGGWVLNRDAADTRIVNDVASGQGPAAPLQNENEVGGFPSIAGGQPCADADHDGMPDAWETAHKLNPNDSSDRNGTTVQPPFTNLEAYLQ